MEDAEKTKEQLISELTSLRQQVTDFEQCKTEMVAEVLRAGEMKYHIIFDNAPIGIFRTTADGRLLDANPELSRMLGYLSPQEMIATTNLTSVAEALYAAPEDRLKLVVDKALSRQRDVGQGGNRFAPQGRRYNHRAAVPSCNSR